MVQDIQEEEIQETGQRFSVALNGRDFNSLQSIFDPDVRSRLLTPSGLATPMDASGLMDKYRQWFEQADYFEVQRMDVSCIGRRLSLSYRVLLQDEDGWSVLEQHACGSLKNGQIVRFDLLCSGFEPAPTPKGD